MSEPLSSALRSTLTVREKLTFIRSCLCSVILSTGVCFTPEFAES